MTFQKYGVLNIILIFISFVGISTAQSRTNLEVIHSLIDSSVNEIIDNIQSENQDYYLNYISLPDYEFLENRLSASLASGTNLIVDSLDRNSTIKYTVDNAGVNYSDAFKSGIFGGFYVKRTALINGSYQIIENNYIVKSRSFNYAASDTVDYDGIKLIEKPSMPFTTSTLPKEPFLPSLVEPLIAIGTVVITVVLFFTVRSN